MKTIFNNPKERKFLITGASGFIGKSLVKYILGEGGKVVACDIKQCDEFSKIEDKRFEFLQADLTKDFTLSEGITDVIHAAGKVADWGSYESFYKINVQATENLLEKSKKAGVKNFLFISSIDIHGFFGHNGNTEDGVYYPSKCFYPKTKMIAEKLVRAFNSSEMKTVCIRPCTVYGPGDTTVQGPMMDAIIKRQMGYIAGGKKLISRIYIDDLVQGLCRALEFGSGGDAYNIVSSEKINWKQWVEEIAKGLNVKPPSFSAPYPIAYALATVMEVFYKVINSKTGPILTRMRIQHAGHDFYFVGDKAKKELDFEPQTDWKTGVKLMTEAYLQDKK